MHDAVLESPYQLEPCAVSDVSETRIGVGAKWPLVDATLPRAVENGAPALELQHPFWRFLCMKLGHVPVID